MKTVLTIQDDLMAELLETTGTTVKKDAVITAIKGYLAMKKREQLADMLGRYEFGYSQAELERMRGDGLNTR